MKTTIRWRPEDGQIYWIVNDRGNVCHSEWCGCQRDYNLWTVGNCYTTKRHAEEVAELVKLAYKK